MLYCLNEIQINVSHVRVHWTVPPYLWRIYWILHTQQRIIFRFIKTKNYSYQNKSRTVVKIETDFQPSSYYCKFNFIPIIIQISAGLFVRGWSSYCAIGEKYADLKVKRNEWTEFCPNLLYSRKYVKCQTFATLKPFNLSFIYKNEPKYIWFDRFWVYMAFVYFVVSTGVGTR